MMLPLTTLGLVRYVSLDMVYESIVFFFSWNIDL